MNIKVYQMEVPTSTIRKLIVDWLKKKGVSNDVVQEDIQFLTEADYPYPFRCVVGGDATLYLQVSNDSPD